MCECSAPFAAVVSNDVNTIPLQARVVDLIHDTYMVTFSITLVWPSNETCVSSWYDTNTLQGTYTVGWYIGESGAYSVGGVQMEFTSMTVNALEFNQATWPYPFGTECNYPTEDDDDDHSPGGIFTIQSNNNPGMFLNIHANSWFKNRVTECNYAWLSGRLKLSPHDYDISASLVNPNDIQDEKVGIFLFEVQAPHSLDCVVGTYMEIGELSNLDQLPYVINTYKKIDSRPSSSSVAVFGAYVYSESVRAAPTLSLTCTFVYIQTHIHAPIFIHMHTYLHTYILTYIHTYIHTYTHAYVHTYILTYILNTLYIYLHAHCAIISLHGTRSHPLYWSHFVLDDMV